MNTHSYTTKISLFVAEKSAALHRKIRGPSQKNLWPPTEKSVASHGKVCGLPRKSLWPPTENPVAPHGKVCEIRLLYSQSCSHHHQHGLYVETS